MGTQGPGHDDKNYYEKKRLYMAIGRSGEAPAPTDHHKHSNHWNLNTRTRRNSAARHRRCDSIFSPSPSPLSTEATGQTSLPTLPFYSSLKYMAPSMLGLAALKYQGKTEGLFQENPVPAWCFLGATFAYSLVIGTMKLQMTTSHNGIWFQMLNRAAIALGLVLPVSLLSIFLPQQVSFWPLLILTPLPVIVLAWPVLHSAYNWVSQIDAKLIIHIIWYWLCTTVVTDAVDNIRAKLVVCWARGRRQESLPK